MRNPVTGIAAAVLAVACTSSNTDDPAAPGLPPQPELLTSSASLRGQPIEESRDGAWVVRRTAGSGGAGSLAGEGRRDRSTVEYELAPGAPADSLALGEPVMDAAPARDGRPAAGTTALPTAEVSSATREVRRVDSGAAPLRAGSTDDNADFAAFLTYLEEKEGQAQLKDRWQPLDVRDRRTIRVVDAGGAPLPGARLQVVDEDADRVAWRGTTQGDGCVPFYPRLAGGDAAPDTWLIEVAVGGETVRHHWNLDGDECVVRVPGATADQGGEIALDVVFVIDTTGSMGDEIERIKATLLGVTERLRSLEREFTLRYGAVLYRDVGDVYVTSAHAFTDDLEAFDEALKKIDASGGGDGPESLNQGLAVAVDEMDWKPGAARVAFLIADAPPHMDYQGDVPYGESLKAAVGKGIRIHAVAASGLDEVGSLVFRQIAQMTRGEFVFIEYGGDVTKSGEAHGVSGVQKSNNLDDILFAKIRDEIATWGRS